MGKKFWIILSIIASFLSLIYMTMVYLGLFRYIKLHNQSIESYYKDYKSKPKTKDRTILVFSDNDLSHIKPFINSLLDQSMRVDDIGLNINYKNMDSVPKSIKDIISVYGQSKDYGSQNTIIPTLYREADDNTKIIIVEPNMVYDENFIVDMIEMSDENPENIIYGKEGSPKHGILVKPKFFKEDVFETKDLLKCLEKCKRKINVLESNNTYTAY